jgi:hypothetical protein
VKYICGLVLCFIASEAVAQNICGPVRNLFCGCGINGKKHK